MDFIHTVGVGFIRWIQGFPNLEPLMIHTSHIGSPLMSYTLVFPAAYYINPILGVLTMLCASFSEWLSGIAKWVLHGHRPYWWVDLHAMTSHTSVTPIKQFSITCETGPGSPSGHCMITLASLVPLVLYLRQSLPSFYGDLVLCTFGCFAIILGLSRCYVAAHFPHQVLAGILSGVMLGYAFAEFFQILRIANTTTRLSLVPKPTGWLVRWVRNPISFLWLGFGSFALASAFAWFLRTVMKVDVNWSIVLAKRSCHRPEWVHLSSSLMVGFARIAGYLSGLALALLLNPPSDSLLATSAIRWCVVFMAGVAVLSTKLFERACQRAFFSLLFPLFPSSNTATPGTVLLITSVAQGSVGPVLSVWILPKLFSLFGI
ncbi:unnamed protein product [Dicrocoelium dendriticum]|nr:unnamed protein product [Dicrocoelium dendriticum]